MRGTRSGLQRSTSASIGAALDAIPPWWLIGLQCYRAGGGLVWLAGWGSGRLPAGFALPAGIGDCLVGLFAVMLATWIYLGARGWRVAGIAWNVFGLLDFLNGFVLASFVPYNFAYPGVMIPGGFARPIHKAAQARDGSREPAGGGAGHSRTILRVGGKLELRR